MRLQAQRALGLALTLAERLLDELFRGQPGPQGLPAALPAACRCCARCLPLLCPLCPPWCLPVSLASASCVCGQSSMVTQHGPREGSAPCCPLTASFWSSSTCTWFRLQPALRRSRCCGTCSWAAPHKAIGVTTTAAAVLGPPPTRVQGVGECKASAALTRLLCRSFHQALRAIWLGSQLLSLVQHPSGAPHHAGGQWWALASVLAHPGQGG